MLYIPSVVGSLMADDPSKINKHVLFSNAKKCLNHITFTINYEK